MHSQLREREKGSFCYGFFKLRGTSNIHFCVFIVVFNLRASGNFSSETGLL